MAAITSPWSVAERIDRYLEYLEAEWAAVPQVVNDWPEWAEDERLDFVLEWSIREDRLHTLTELCAAGEMSPEQGARFGLLKALVACNRTAIDNLLNE